MAEESGAKRAQSKSSASSGVHAALLRSRKTPPPVLASDILREDLAPIDPGPRATRICHAAAALLLLAVAFALRGRIGLAAGSPNAGAICAAAAAAAAATAMAPIGYRWRAAVGAAIGLAVMVVGLFGRGPLGLLDDGPGVLSWGGFRVIAAIVLPAALLFRSHYRAYERGKAILAFAYALSAPFLLDLALLALGGTEVAAQLTASVTLLVLLSGLFALLGTPPIYITVWIAGMFTVATTVDLLFVESGGVGLSRVLASLVLLACAAPASLGLFQLLASVYAPDARRVDVHKPTEPQLPAPRPSQVE
jgi:hypothetical protein